MSFFILFLLSIYSIYPQNYLPSDKVIIKRDLKGNVTQNFTSEGTQFSITSDKSRYEEGEDIPLFLRIKNMGNYPVSLYIHENYLQNFTIVVRDEKGRNLPIREIAHRSKTRISEKHYYRNYTGTLNNYRVIILQPNEIFVKKIILQDVIEIAKKGNDIKKFQIQAYFYPNPGQAETIFLSSINHYVVFIESNKNLYRNQKIAFYSEEERGVTPKEIVYLVLSAEYAGEWSSFLKYLSLHDLIKDYPEYARRYIRSSTNQRAIVLDNFRSYLQSNHVHKLVRFNVISNKTNEYLRKSSKQIKTIQAEATRIIDGFQRKFIYTYYLTKKDSFWKITGIESQLLE